LSKDDIHQKWTVWVTEVIANDIFKLRVYQRRWKELVDIAQSNPDIPDPQPFLRWITELYGVFIAIGIRRQADSSRDVINMHRLLRDIMANPTVITRDRYIKLSRGGQESSPFDSEIEHAFDNWAGGRNAHVDPAVVGQDLARLRSMSAQIGHWVSKRVAHHTTDETKIPTIGELHAAMDELGELLKRYWRFITGNTLADTTPVDSKDWKSAFLVTWAPDEDYLQFLRQQQGGQH
jgi:hypothetical protein